MNRGALEDGALGEGEKIMLKMKPGRGNRLYRHSQSELLSHAIDSRDFPIPQSGSPNGRIVDRGTRAEQPLNPLALRSTVEQRIHENATDASFGLSLYLRQAFQTPLLTQDEERTLAQQIFRYRQAFQRMIVKEPAVIEYLTDLLSKWESKKCRLDAICNLALSDRANRKVLEPKIRSSLKILRRYPKRLKAAKTPAEVKQIEREMIHLVEELLIRPRHFELSPFENPNAQPLLDEYRMRCQHMTRANMRLVVLVARQLCGRSAVLLDMIQEGSRGLMHAVVKFDHRRQIKFSTYATPWIKQTIFASLPNAQRNIRVPENFRSLGREVQRRMNDHTEAFHDRGRNMELIADDMKMPLMELERLICVQQDTCSLDQAVGDGVDTASLGELIPDHRPNNPRRNAHLHERQMFARSLMDEVLNRKEHDVISLRFGIGDGVDRSLAEVGRVMGLTRERVRQLEKKAIGKLGERAGL